MSFLDILTNEVYERHCVKIMGGADKKEIKKTGFKFITRSVNFKQLLDVVNAMPFINFIGQNV